MYDIEKHEHTMIPGTPLIMSLKASLDVKASEDSPVGLESGGL